MSYLTLTIKRSLSMVFKASQYLLIPPETLPQVLSSFLLKLQLVTFRTLVV